MPKPGSVLDYLIQATSQALMPRRNRGKTNRDTVIKINAGSAIKSQVLRFFDTVDLDQDEELSNEELETKAKQLLGIIFETLDMDDDGVISSPEEMFTIIKTSVFDKLLNEVFPLFAGDNQLSPQDFTSYWEQLFKSNWDSSLITRDSWPHMLDQLQSSAVISGPCRRSKKLCQRVIKDLKSLAEKIDTDGDGQYTRTEVAGALFSILQSFDLDLDGSLDLDEIVTAANSVGLLDEANMRWNKGLYQILVRATKPFLKTFLELVGDNDDTLTKPEFLDVLDVDVKTLESSFTDHFEEFIGSGGVNNPLGDFLENVRNPLPKQSSRRKQDKLTEEVFTWVEEKISSLIIPAQDRQPQDAPLVHGAWSNWSGWIPSSVECSKKCGGGLESQVKTRRCSNPAPSGGGRQCRGDYIMSREQGECNTRDCVCQLPGSGPVTEFCKTLPTVIRREQRRKFCILKLEDKRKVLMCPEVSPKMAEMLLETSVDGCPCKDSVCDYDPADVLDGDCGQLLQDKLKKNCNSDCVVKKQETNKILIEVLYSTTTVLTQKNEALEIKKKLNTAVKVLAESAKLGEGLKELTEERDKEKETLIDTINKNPHITVEKKNELKQTVIAAFDIDTNELTTNHDQIIATANTELTAINVETGKLDNVKKAVKTKFNTLKQSIKGMSKADALVKTSTALSGILTSVDKFQDGSALNVLSGAVDVANAIAQFLPPPASIITGTISSIMSIFTGGGPSTEDVIKEELKKQTEWMETKFNQIDGRFDKLDSELRRGFNALSVELKGSIQEVKDKIASLGTQLNGQILEQFNQHRELLLLKGLKDMARHARGSLDTLQQQVNFIIVADSTDHKDDAVNHILSLFNLFEKEEAKSNLRAFIEDKCANRKETELRELCQLLAYTYLMMERTGEILLAKTITFLADSSKLKSLVPAYLDQLEYRKNTTLEFMKLVFTDKEPQSQKFFYISCGLSDHSLARLEPEQKQNLLEYAKHLDSGTRLRLERRESCVDGVMTAWNWKPEWKWSWYWNWSKISTLCEGKGRKAQTRHCVTQAKDGGVECGKTYRCEDCSNSVCPVRDGEWSGKTYQMDSSCGDEMKRWNRACNNPSPRNGGDKCQGETTGCEACDTQDTQDCRLYCLCIDLRLK